jgi:glyoxylase-like metal-dependent hydrolase (beta-lactamase superfamily II)
MARFDIIMQGSSLRTDQASLGICTIALIRDRGTILLDTGHFGTRRQVLASLERLGVKPVDIDHVILSHAHWDHSLNLELFPKATVVINSKELDFIHRVKGDDWATPNVIAILLDRMKVQTTKGDEDLTDDVRVIETPGHSPGHQAVLVKTDEGGALFTQDAMPTMRSYLRGLPDFIVTTEREARRSVEKLKGLNPTLYYPGHDRPFRIVDGRPEYVGHSTLGIIVRRETEENFRIVLGTEEAEKPERM